MKHAVPVIYDDETKLAYVAVRDAATSEPQLQAIVKITSGPATGGIGQVVGSDGTDTEWGAAPAAPGGVAGSVVVTVDFGSGGEAGLARTTVTGQTWAASLATMTYLCQVDAATTDHESPAEEACLEGLIASVQNVVPGVGFDLVVGAMNRSQGEWSFRVVGLSL